MPTYEAYHRVQGYEIDILLLCCLWRDYQHTYATHHSFWELSKQGSHKGSNSLGLIFLTTNHQLVAVGFPIPWDSTYNGENLEVWLLAKDQCSVVCLGVVVMQLEVHVDKCQHILSEDFVFLGSDECGEPRVLRWT